MHTGDIGLTTSENGIFRIFGHADLILHLVVFTGSLDLVDSGS